MKKSILISLILFVSTSCFAGIPPSPLKNCARDIKGEVTGLYAENWDRRVAIKIGEDFYYISNHSDDGYVKATYTTAMAAYLTGATVTIKECQSDGSIDSIQVE
ncbi:hypothetical protein NG99_08100 [Erwinia typographi]|uniref:Lipoprotein n=1 Tax=Erwinia typographi TaxID=371042 RepID=A0A0A4A9Q9_9GAMM|nr:hypothetical protein [Erwinia typographi]KGT94568.1 hypothetical protein NG99_08100 [Erwinia typographi]